MSVSLLGGVFAPQPPSLPKRKKRGVLHPPAIWPLAPTRILRRVVIKKRQMNPAINKGFNRDEEEMGHPNCGVVKYPNGRG